MFDKTKMVRSWLFPFFGNLQFWNFLQKSFITLTTGRELKWDHWDSMNMGGSMMERYRQKLDPKPPQQPEWAQNQDGNRDKINFY